jgi:hypothetical protein
MEKEAIANVLNNLLKNKEVLGCMVVDRNMNYVMPTAEKFDVGVNKVMGDVKRTCGNVFKMIDSYSKVKLKEMKWTFKDCEVWFYVFPDFQSTLVAIIPQFSDEELLESKLEKARQKILKIIKEKPMLSS